MTLAALGLLVACDGGPAGPTDLGTGSGTESAPVAGDPAPWDADKPPGNPDQPPGNPDQPPGNPDQPPGSGGPGGPPGQGSTPCTRLCERYPECPGNDQVNARVRQLCDDDCESVDSKPECAALVATAIACASALPGLCTEEGTGAAAAACLASVQAADDCTNDDDGPQQPPAGCTPAGGCDCGTDVCEICRCGGGGASCDAFCE